MQRLFHVTSSRNRESVSKHGLDWRKMGAAPGIAGSDGPEQAGVFLCLDEAEVEWFLRLNNTAGPVDVWAVDGISAEELLLSPEGHHYLPQSVPPARLTLLRRDLDAR